MTSHRARALSRSPGPAPQGIELPPHSPYVRQGPSLLLRWSCDPLSRPLRSPQPRGRNRRLGELAAVPSNSMRASTAVQVASWIKYGCGSWYHPPRGWGSAGHESNTITGLSQESLRRLTRSAPRSALRSGGPSPRDPTWSRVGSTAALPTGMASETTDPQPQGIDCRQRQNDPGSISRAGVVSLAAHAEGKAEPSCASPVGTGPWRNPRAYDPVWQARNCGATGGEMLRARSDHRAQSSPAPGRSGVRKIRTPSALYPPFRRVPTPPPRRSDVTGPMRVPGL